MRAARDDDVIQGEMVRERLASPGHSTREHLPRFRLAASGDDRVERRGHLGAADLGQKPQMAEVDTEQRRVGRRVRDGARGLEQRAVAAKRHDDIDRGRQCLFRRRPPAMSETGRVRAFDLDDGRAAMSLEPLGRLGERRERRGERPSGQESGVGNRHHVVGCCTGIGASSRKNS